MSSARAAATVTWVYALGFGLATAPVSIYWLRSGQLPRFFGLFEMFGGPWSASTSDRTFVGLLLFCAVTLVAFCSAWLLWQGRRIGAVLNLAVLPVEAVFWIGFALPLPWTTGLARVILIAVAWNSLSKSGIRPSSRPDCPERAHQPPTGDNQNPSVRTSQCARASRASQRRQGRRRASPSGPL